MRPWTAIFMSGIGFTLGLLCGLLIHLPAETLPTSSFDDHHLARVRRMAEVEGSSVGAGPDGLPTEELTSGFIGETYKHLQSGVLNNGYTEDKAISKDIPSAFGGLKLSSNGNSNSVVYVNPSEHKLVLDKNVNNVSDTSNHGKAYVKDTATVNNVIPDKIDVTGQDNQWVAAQGHHDHVVQPLAAGDSPVTSGVFWTGSVESTCSMGFTSEDHNLWKSKESKEKIVDMNEGCGRMQNRILTFQNFDKACARYRLNIDQIQGEIYSYYLSKLLGINNVPPSNLHLADTNQDQWRMVGKAVANARWSEEKPVILSKWIPGLEPAFIPKEFRNLSNTFETKVLQGNSRWVSGRLVKADTGSSLCELLQWSDLIVFDYITANLDRVVNNLFNLQWNERMMSKPAHNLEIGARGNLVFLDNESGLFHGYRLLDKYSVYHRSLLQSLCVFRHRTISSIQKFVESDSIGEALQSIFEENEPLYRHVPRVPVKNIKILKQRMTDVLNQVRNCESLLNR